MKHWHILLEEKLSSRIIALEIEGNVSKFAFLALHNYMQT